MPVRAGALNRRVEIEQAVEGLDADGGLQQTSWTLVARVWAAIEPLNGREPYLSAGQIEHGTVTHTMRLRYHEAIVLGAKSGKPVPKMRATYGGRTFDVQAVLNPGERRELLVLTVKERV